MNIQMPVPRDGPYSRETHVGLFPAAAASAGAATFFIFCLFFSAFGVSHDLTHPVITRRSLFLIHGPKGGGDGRIASMHRL
jgi:hypothetical protein